MNYKDHISLEMPSRGNAITRSIGRLILKVLGWKIVGKLPNEKKVILIGEPHTSNWDFILAMAASQATGLRFTFIMKREAFFWPFSNFFIWLGGLPIDREKGRDSFQQIREFVSSQDKVWLAMTPKGKRIPLESYKTGYLRISRDLDIPIFIIALNGQTKTIVLDKIITSTGKIKAQNKSIKDYIDGTYRGIKPENQRPGELPKEFLGPIIGAVHPASPPSASIDGQ